MGLTSRCPIAWLLAVAVPVGAFCAPFLHAHVDEDTDHHHPTAVHAHLSGHERDHHDHEGVTVQEPEHDRAIYLQAYVAVSTALFDVPAATPALFGLSTPPEQPAHPTVEVTHGHDPPLLPSLHSRPPPSLPV